MFRLLFVVALMFCNCGFRLVLLWYVCLSLFGWACCCSFECVVVVVVMFVLLLLVVMLLCWLLLDCACCRGGIFGWCCLFAFVVWSLVFVGFWGECC